MGNRRRDFGNRVGLIDLLPRGEAVDHDKADDHGADAEQHRADGLSGEHAFRAEAMRRTTRRAACRPSRGPS